MKVLLDTSVLVAAVVLAHPAHTRAQPWLKRGRTREIELIVAAHSLAETYSVLTTLPVRPRITPALAWRLVHENVAGIATVMGLSPAEYSATLRRLAELSITGGAVYDGLVARVAQKAQVDRLLTLDADIARVWPEGRDRISAP